MRFFFSCERKLLLIHLDRLIEREQREVVHRHGSMYIEFQASAKAFDLIVCMQILLIFILFGCFDHIDSAFKLYVLCFSIVKTQF